MRSYFRIEALSINIGDLVAVTTDEQIFEKECKASRIGSSWSHEMNQQKLGAQGEIMKVDFRDCTVEMDDDIGWVPIKALVGYENWSSAKKLTAFNTY